MPRVHFSHRTHLGHIHTLDVGNGHISDDRLLIRPKVELQAVQAYSLTSVVDIGLSS